MNKVRETINKKRTDYEKERVKGLILAGKSIKEIMDEEYDGYKTGCSDYAFIANMRRELNKEGLLDVKAKSISSKKAPKEDTRTIAVTADSVNKSEVALSDDSNKEVTKENQNSDNKVISIISEPNSAFKELLDDISDDIARYERKLSQLKRRKELLLSLVR